MCVPTVFLFRRNCASAVPFAERECICAAVGQCLNRTAGNGQHQADNKSTQPLPSKQHICQYKCRRKAKQSGCKNACRMKKQHARHTEQNRTASQHQPEYCLCMLRDKQPGQIYNRCADTGTCGEHAERIPAEKYNAQYNAEYNHRQHGQYHAERIVY